ncbi:hypothetical protein H9P43_003963 [Blastocladiella emersonii ATCC 22665]|nr:hypothetical protein H9P43_003963 [Blastocladiella emersonii ATCC 22665]
MAPSASPPPAPRSPGTPKLAVPPELAHLYGPNRDNAPHRFRFPPMAIQPDFYCSFRDPRAPAVPEWNTTTREKYVPHTHRRGADAREGNAKNAEAASFNDTPHFTLGRSAESLPGGDALRYLTVANRDYTPHELPDTTDTVNHENMYPPVFHDESALVTPARSLYGESFRGDPLANRAALASSARARRQRLRGDNIVLGSEEEEMTAEAARKGWQSVTQSEYGPVDAVASAAGAEQRALANAVRSRDKLPSTVLDRPDGEASDCRSTFQTDFTTHRDAEQVDLKFKEELEGTHISLATQDTPEASSFTSQYRSNFLGASTQRVPRATFPATVLLREEPDATSAHLTSSPTRSTTHASYPRHPVPRHVPVHRVFESHVFQGRPDDDAVVLAAATAVSASASADGQPPATDPAAPMVSVTRADFHLANAGGDWRRASCRDRGQHVLVPEDGSPASLSVSASESRDAFGRGAPPADAKGFRLMRRTTRALVAAVNESHFDLAPDSATAPLAAATTARDHHGATARAAAGYPAGAFRRAPILPDRTFATSLHNTVQWQDAREFGGVSTTRTTFKGPPDGFTRREPIPAVVGNADHLGNGAVERAAGIAVAEEGSGGEWVSTTHRVHGPPARMRA